MGTDTKVTIVVTPREKFSVVKRSLESIIDDTEKPYALVYVDAGSPRPIRRYLEEAASKHGFTLVRTDHFLSPNQARNLGFKQVTTDHVVFIDNDVVVTPGWLQPLVDCAEKTGADIVSPLICQGHPIHEIVHCAGGTCGVKEISFKGEKERHLYEHIAKQGRKVADIRPKLARSKTGLAEFHCMLIRSDTLRRFGPLDEKIMNTREHVDFCMIVNEAGGSVYLEPDSLVTYLHDTPLQRSDVPYFMLRWGNEWERNSLLRLIEKYDLSTAGTLGNRLRNVGWRRRAYLVHPFARRLAGTGSGPRYRFFRRSLKVVDRVANAWLNQRYRSRVKHSV